MKFCILETELGTLELYFDNYKTCFIELLPKDRVLPGEFIKFFNNELYLWIDHSIWISIEHEKYQDIDRIKDFLAIYDFPCIENIKKSVSESLNWVEYWEDL